MKQIIIIHGGDLFPTEDAFNKALSGREYNPFEEKKNWRARLEQQIQGHYQVINPTMPNKENARYAAWKIRFEKILPYLNDEELSMVGYSLGGMFLIKYLGENHFPQKIKKLHLVAPVFDESDMSEEENYLGDFVYDPKIISNLETKAEEIFIYHSKDDNIVPYAHVEKIKSYLPKAKILTFTDRGHFYQPEFPELLENILS